MESAQLRADPGSRSLRAAALVAGTLGLVAIGVLAIMVTPRADDTPLAIEPDPSFVDPRAIVPLTTSLLDRAAGELSGAFGVSRPESDRTSVASLAATTLPAPGPRGLSAPLATLLESGVAIVTAKSIHGLATGDALAVRLASGRTFEAEVLATVGHAALVAIGSLITDEPAHEVADAVPGGDAMVTVLVSPPLSVRLGELASTGAPEGTAVVDATGRLIGLCTEDADGNTSLAPAIDAGEPGSQPVAPTSTIAAAPTTTHSGVTTTVAATTSSTSTTSTSTSTTSSTTSTTSTSTPTTVAPGG